MVTWWVGNTSVQFSQSCECMMSWTDYRLIFTIMWWVLSPSHTDHSDCSFPIKIEQLNPPGSRLCLFQYDPIARLQGMISDVVMVHSYILMESLYFYVGWILVRRSYITTLWLNSFMFFGKPECCKGGICSLFYKFTLFIYWTFLLEFRENNEKWNKKDKELHYSKHSGRFKNEIETLHLLVY